jgi:hypothetical protein
MKATQAGIVVRSMPHGHTVAAQSASSVTAGDPALARHTANVHQLLAHRLATAMPAPAPDGDEIIGLVAQVYGITAAQATDRLRAINFADRAPSAA